MLPTTPGNVPAVMPRYCGGRSHGKTDTDTDGKEVEGGYRFKSHKPVTLLGCVLVVGTRYNPLVDGAI